MSGTSRAPRPAPTDAEDLRVRVQKVLDDLLSRQLRSLDDVSPELSPLVEALGELLRGGKRLRPAFCYWGWRGAGGADRHEIVAAASALELLHACALVHDDVMDGSDIRRGMPAAHRRFAALHRGNGWTGAPDSFGTGAAILLGDLCLSWASELLWRCGLPAADLGRARPVYDLMCTELMAGQYLDLLEQARGGATEDARRVLLFKSAKYTVERPLHLGAALAGAPEEVVRAYTAYGVPLGEAFQLRDDLLGVFGDPSVTGKPAGDDLREGKRTVLIGYALEHASPLQAATVRRHLGDAHLDADGLAALREVLTDTGARRHVEALIDDLTARALDALVRAPVEASARGVLHDLAIAATSREG